MPHLMLFVACERVSYEAGTSAATLIGVFQGFNVSLTKEEPKDSAAALLPPHQVSAGEPVVGLPIRWTAFSLWRRLPDDADKEFTQICELIAPDGEKLTATTPLTFKMTQNFQRNTMNIQNFPIGRAGDYQLLLFLKEGGGEPKLVAEYPILVTHQLDEGVTVKDK